MTTVPRIPPPGLWAAQRGAWLLFFAVILGAWWWLYAMATGMGMTLTGGMQMPASGEMSGSAEMSAMGEMSGMEAMPESDAMPEGGAIPEGGAMPDAGGMSGMGEMAEMGGMAEMAAMTSPTVLILMWVIMMAAMMGPTFVPTARTYEDLIGTGAGTRPGFFGLVAGYLAVWFGFGAGIGLLHAALVYQGLVDGMGQSASRMLSVVILAMAGIYQFTSAKDRCLDYCRSPMVHFLARWRSGPWGGAQMGARVGVWCVACCWGIMLIGFVGGAMNLAWMGIATLIMTLEKLPDIGRWLTRPLGLMFLGAAGLTAVGLI